MVAMAGCYGGFPWDAWKCSRDEKGGRLSSASKYPYVGYTDKCRAADTSNVAVGAKITE